MLNARGFTGHEPHQFRGGGYELGPDLYRVCRSVTCEAMRRHEDESGRAWQ